MSDVLSVGITSPFIVFAPATSQGERRQIEEMAGALIDMGCIEFSCVGTEAEELHDALDWIIVDKGALDVTTTWVVDETDACDYILFAAGGAQYSLLAIVSDHPALEALLTKIAQTDDVT